MKCLQFNFNHPVTGNACLKKLYADSPDLKYLHVDSKLSNLLEIPIQDCRSGKWRITLDWNYEGRFFTHQQDFEVV